MSPVVRVAPRRASPCPVLSRPASTRPGSPPLRLTRRGRLVLATGLLMLLALVIVVLAPASRAADSDDRRPRTTVVRPGDTLWSIAERQLPERDRSLVIAEIRRLNGLDGYTIYAGQELILPAAR